MTVLELLIKARQRIDKPQKWCSYWCQSDDGRRLGTDGVVWWAAGDDKELAEQAFHILAQHSGACPTWPELERVIYLDRHKDVMDMFDKAIEECKKPMETE